MVATMMFEMMKIVMIFTLAYAIDALLIFIVFGLHFACIFSVTMFYFDDNEYVQAFGDTVFHTISAMKSKFGSIVENQARVTDEQADVARRWTLMQHEADVAGGWTLMDFVPSEDENEDGSDGDDGSFDSVPSFGFIDDVSALSDVESLIFD